MEADLWNLLAKSHSEKRLYRHPTTSFFLGGAILLTLMACNSTLVPSRSKVTTEHYLASQMQPSACCVENWK